MDICKIISGKDGKRLLLRRMDLQEAQIAMNLQTRVWAHMPNPALLAETSMEEICESMKEDICLGVFDGARLAAFSLMVVNRESERRNAGQKNGEPPQECVTFDTIFVDPEDRGIGLQKALFSEQEKLAAALGAKQIFATVAPENSYSLNNMLACGFEIYARKRLYGNRDRYIMRKMLQK